MARHSVPPPKPKSPILTVGQKRRRIERLQKCITSLETFDSQKVRKRFGNPEVLTLGAAIDKALSSAFGYGTPAYLRYNQAATLDPGPLITNATLCNPVLPPVGGPGRHDAQVQEARQYFSEGKFRWLPNWCVTADEASGPYRTSICIVVTGSAPMTLWSAIMHSAS
jgi:hypothetical protein